MPSVIQAFMRALHGGWRRQHRTIAADKGLRAAALDEDLHQNRRISPVSSSLMIGPRRLTDGYGVLPLPYFERRVKDEHRVVN